MKSWRKDDREALHGSLPSWWRVLGWGLLASVVLHWIAMDLLRGAGLQRSASGRNALEVRLHAPEPQTAQATPLAAAPAATLADKHVAVKSTGGAPTSRVPVPAAENSSARAAERPSAGETPTIAGLRSGRASEALVALRLAFAQSLDGLLPSGNTATTLWCDFDAQGRLSKVHGEGLDADIAMLAAVKAAAARITLPEALRGGPFTLDLLLESGGAAP